jgi:hypothetical protein
MAWDLAVILEDHPGTLADMGEALGDAGVNIDGISGMGRGGEGTVHILVPDGNAARDALATAGITSGDPREVLAVGCEDRPGELGRLASKIAAAGANIDLVYVAMDGRIVLGVDHLHAAKQAVGAD